MDRPDSSDCAGKPESKRLAALDRYDILDTAPEETFDRITRLVRQVFNVPMATLSFIDGHRLWYKSRQGVDAPELERQTALCNTTIQHEGPLIVPDTHADTRFSGNVHVTGASNLKFYAGMPLRSADGQAIGTLCALDTKPHAVAEDKSDALRDLAHIVMDELELRQLATTDSLTGALTRRAFHQAATRAIALAARHRYEVGCILVDLDHFKTVNDQHGHAAGDAILRDIAALCRDRLRKSDLFGRVGGEEFAILLPHTGREAAMKVAAKLRSAIARHHVPTGQGDLAVTASFGTATLDTPNLDIGALLARADTVLHEAKSEGRNRCIAWQPPLSAIPPTLRRRVLKAGRITFNLGRSTIDCTVRSMSETGAGIDVISSAGIPERFRLQIEADGLLLPCRLTSKTAKHLDVDFEPAAAVAA